MICSRPAKVSGNKRGFVVFDGYGRGPSTKYTAHLRRSRGVVGPQVNFTSAMSPSIERALSV